MTILLFAFQAILVAILIVGLFRVRATLTLAPFYISLGGFQYLQVLLAASVYVEIGGLLLSPGSAILYTAWVFALLLVYIREDAHESRSAMYGLLIANLSLVILSTLFGLQLRLPDARNLLSIPVELFYTDIRIMTVGTFALAIEIPLLILLYERISRLTERVFFRLVLTGALVMTLDAVLFTAGAFYPSEHLVRMMLSSLVGKLAACLFFAAALAVYLEVEGRTARSEKERREDLFHRLSYRQRFEEAQHKLIRDPLTGVFSRGFYDEEIERRLVSAQANDGSTTLCLLDLDHFKQINDQFGHQEGDRVLREVGALLRTTLRQTDGAFRVGGEEFAILLDDIGPGVSSELASRLCENVRQLGKEHSLAGGVVTATIGVAIYPLEASNADELFRLADRRLYFGKAAGRDLVIAEGEGLSGSVSRPFIDEILTAQPADTQDRNDRLSTPLAGTSEPRESRL